MVDYWVRQEPIATSNGVDTNPVKRGVWILENLPHMPPPPAPEDVPAIEQSGENKSKSLIDLLAFHRENQACAKCHDKIDSMGVPLEGFDPIGRLRNKYENKAVVEAVMTKSDGRVYRWRSRCERLLLENKEHFYGCLLESSWNLPLAANWNISMKKKLTTSSKEPSLEVRDSEH